MASLEVNQLLHDYEELFMTSGWKHFVSNIEENKKALVPMLLANTSGERDLQFCKGRNEVYEYILGFESQIKAIREQVEMEASLSDAL